MDRDDHERTDVVGSSRKTSRKMSPVSFDASRGSPTRRRWQFRLRTPLLFVSGVALLLGFLVPYVRKREERRLVAELKGAGCQIVYAYEWDSSRQRGVEGARPSAPAWIRRIAGEDVFVHPISVECPLETSDQVLRTTGRLTSLTSVRFNGLSAVSEPFKAISTLSRLKTIRTFGPTDLHDLAQVPPMPGVTTLELAARP